MISGRVIETTADYRAALRTLTPGVVAELEVRRGSDGRIDHVHVEPGCTQPAAYPLSRIRELRAAARLPVSSEPLMDAATARLTLRGLKVRLGMNVSLQSNSAASGGACLIVTKVYPQSNAATMGFQPGYALLAVVSTMGAEVPLRSDLHLVAILNSYAPGDTLVLRVIPLNGASPRLLSIELDAANASREFVRSTRFIAGLLSDERA
jgi:S1-C subfamily serine protease